MNDWLSNFNLMKSMNDLTQSIGQFTEGTKQFFHIISQGVYYISHPAVLGSAIWSGALSISFILCLAICLGGIILYIIGYHKGATWAKISFFAYLSIHIFNSLL